MASSDKLNLVYPLGNGFTLSKGKILLIGGGVGIAPLLETGAALKEVGAEVSFLLGARTATDLVELNLYQQIGTVYVTASDIAPGPEVLPDITIE